MLEIETNNISFDTSFIESQNFLHGSKLKELTRLAHNGTIKLFITDITYREILARFKKNLQTADEKIKKPQRDIEINSRVLRNFKYTLSLHDALPI